MAFESLESEKLNRFQRKITLLSSAGTFLDGFDLTVIALTLPFVEKQWHIGAGMEGLLAASAVIGMLIGSLVLGNLTDLFGRKAMYIVDLLSFVVFAALAAFSQNILELVIFRFLLGLGIGADYPISGTLLTEFSPTKRRGRQVTSLGAMWFVGAVAAYLVGIALTPIGPQAWRYMLLVGAAIAVVVLIFRASIPESPRWLVSKNRAGDAEKVLKDLTGSTAQLSQSNYKKYKWYEMFGKKFWRATLFVSGFWFCYDVAHYGISLFTPTILEPFTHGSNLYDNIGGAIVSVVGAIGAFIGLAVVDKWGRRPLILTSFIGLTLMLVILAFDPTPVIVQLVILFALAELFANMGPGILDFVYSTELFPTSIRASASGFATAMSRVGAILGLVVFPQLVNSWGLSLSLWFFAFFGAVGLVLSIWLAPETKNRSIDELSNEG